MWHCLRLSEWLFHTNECTKKCILPFWYYTLYLKFALDVNSSDGPNLYNFCTLLIKSYVSFMWLALGQNFLWLHSVIQLMVSFKEFSYFTCLGGCIAINIFFCHELYPSCMSYPPFFLLQLLQYDFFF